MTRPGQKQLSSEQRSEIARRVATGEKPSALAREFGVLERQIYRIRDKLLTEEERRLRPDARRSPERTKEDVVRRVEEGERVAALAVEYELDRGTIYRWVRPLGVRPPLRLSPEVKAAKAATPPGRPGRKPVADDIQAAIVTKVLTGQTIASVAREYKLSTRAVGRYLNKHRAKPGS